MITPPVTRLSTYFRPSAVTAAIRAVLLAETLAALACLPTPAAAQPAGGQVAAGRAAISRQGARMDIDQSSERAVINWRSFNIGRGEQVNFNQPGRDSATLNRVVGNDPSRIMGRLTANGSVYLINQNGILVGKKAQINVGSLVASTANVKTDDFMAGRLNFDDPGHPEARIVNRGRISVAEGGLAALVAPGVENHGSIDARLGKVTLAGGEAFTLDLHGDQLITLTVPQDQLGRIRDAAGRPLSHYVTNTGAITADGGNIALTAETGRQIVDSLINLQGHVQAQTVENRDGVISLSGDNRTQVTVAGTLDASGKAAGAAGGTVAIRGDAVKLADTARIDVSGDGDGGTALVGGDYQGQGEGVKARATDVAGSAVIDADSRTAGHGGQVVVWSEDRTRFAGRITARGGSESGDGGLVEVSGKRQLGFDGQVDASARHGKAGELLLDPGDLTVANIPPEQNSQALKPSESGGTAYWQGDADTDRVVNAQKVNYLLQGGTSVALKASNDLTVAAEIDGRAVDGAPGGGVTLNAGRHVNLKDNVLTHDGAITIQAATGHVTMDPGKALHAGNQPISVSAGGDVDAQHLVTSGAITVKAGGNATLRQTLAGENTGGGHQGIGSLQIEAGGRVGLNGALAKGTVTVSRADRLDLDTQPIVAGGQVDLNARTITVNPSSGIEARGGLTMQGETGIAVKADLVTRDAPLTLTSTGGRIEASHGAAGGQREVLLAAGTGPITVNARDGITVGQINTSGKAVLMSSGGGIEAKASLAAGDLELDAHGDVALRDVCVSDGLQCGANDAPPAPLETTDADPCATAGLECGSTTIRSHGGNIIHRGTLIADRAVMFDATDTDAKSGGTVTLGTVDIRKAGAGFGVLAGKGVTVTDTVRTRGGSIGLTSRQGDITMADKTALHVRDRDPQAQDSQGAITLNTGGAITAEHLVTTGAIDLKAGGAVRLKQALAGEKIDEGANRGIGSLRVDAGGDVTLNGVQANGPVGIASAAGIAVNKPLIAAGHVNMRGNTLKVNTGAGIDTRGMTHDQTGHELNLHTTGDMTVNADLITGNATLWLFSETGTLTTGPGIVLDSGAAGLNLLSGGDIVLHDLCLVSGGQCDTASEPAPGSEAPLPAAIYSKNGNILLDGVLIGNRSVELATHGRISLGTIDLRRQKAATLRLGSDGNMALNGDLLTQDGAQTLFTAGRLTMAAGKRLESGAAPIDIHATGNVTLHDVFTLRTLRVTSEQGRAGFNGDLTVGALQVSAGEAIALTQSLAISRGGLTGGSLNLIIRQTGHDAPVANDIYLGEPKSDAHYLIVPHAALDEILSKPIAKSPVTLGVTLGSTVISNSVPGQTPTPVPTLELPQFNNLPMNSVPRTGTGSLGKGYSGGTPGKTVVAGSGSAKPVSGSYGGHRPGSRAADPDAIRHTPSPPSGGGTSGGNQTPGDGSTSGGTVTPGGSGTPPASGNGGASGGSGVSGGDSVAGNGTAGNGTAGTVANQTVNYANAPEQEAAAPALIANPEEEDLEIILGGGGDAENADLGRTSPEMGAARDIYARKHFVVCRGKDLKVPSQGKVPACRG